MQILILQRTHEFIGRMEVRRFFQKLRVPFALAAAGLLITYAEPRMFLPALFVSLAGELLQAWCFGTLDKKQELAATGPYALVRNPMYLGRYFLILGALLLTGSAWIPLPFTVLYYFYMVNRVRREETVLREIFGREYEEYCSGVPRFLPSLKAYRGNPVLAFRPDLFLRNHGHWNLLSVAAFFVLVYIKIR